MDLLLHSHIRMLSLFFERWLLLGEYSDLSVADAWLGFFLVHSNASTLWISVNLARFLVWWTETLHFSTRLLLWIIFKNVFLQDSGMWTIASVFYTSILMLNFRIRKVKNTKTRRVIVDMMDCRAAVIYVLSLRSSWERLESRVTGSEFIQYIQPSQALRVISNHFAHF